MNFELSPEQRLLQETTLRFLANECPVARVREIADGEPGHDPALWKGLAQLGLAGLAIPEAQGGAGLELLDLALAAEALGRACCPGPFLGHSLAGLAIARGGSPEQQRHWLPRLASGEAIGTVALAEAGGAWDPAEWQLACGRELRGEKLHVPLARCADVFVVGVAGGGLALVERRAAGLAIGDLQGVDRSRRLDSLRFEGTPCELLPEGRGAAPRVRDAGLVLLAADALAAGSRLVELSVEYARTREQFGVSIGHFQAVKHQLVNMAVAIEPARALTWYAAHAFDHVPEEAARSAALAKAHLADQALEIARAAVEVHGGIGFTWDCDVQLWFKRALFDRAFLGTPELHRERAAQLAGW